MRLILVTKSSPDWGKDAERHRRAIDYGEVRTAAGKNGNLCLNPDAPNHLDHPHFLAPPTPELLAWAQEHHFKHIMEDMRK